MVMMFYSLPFSFFQKEDFNFLLFSILECQNHALERVSYLLELKGEGPNG